MLSGGFCRGKGKQGAVGVMGSVWFGMRRWLGKGGLCAGGPAEGYGGFEPAPSAVCPFDPCRSSFSAARSNPCFNPCLYMCTL